MGEGKEKPQPKPSPDITEELGKLREEIVCGPGDSCQSIPSGRGSILDEGGEPGETEPYYPPQPVPQEGSDGSPEKPREPIDPGDFMGAGMPLEQKFPKMKPIIENMKKIAREEFLDKDQTVIGSNEDIDWSNLLKPHMWLSSNAWWKTGNPELPNVQKISELMMEAMLYKAVCDNWDEQTLYEQYKLKMRELYSECAANKSAIKEVTDPISTIWLSIWTSNPSSSRAVENPHLKTKKLKPNDIPGLISSLTSVEALFKGTNKNLVLPDVPTYCVEWDFGDNECETSEDEDDFNSDMIEWVNEVGIPFYRNYLIYRAIMENYSKKTLENDYKLILSRLYKNALK